MPETLVVPHLYVRGWTGQPVEQRTDADWFVGGKAVPLLSRMSLIAALKTRFKDPDTCLVQYAPRGEDTFRFPRLRGTVVALRPDVSFQSLFIDIDHTNHTPPPEGWAEDIVSKLQGEWAESVAWYRTPNGMRLVWALEQPVELQFADSFIHQAHEALHTQGIPSDASTTDWTRLFRAPRAGGRTYPMDLSALEEGRTLKWMPEVLTEAAPQSIGTPVSRSHDEAMRHVQEFKLTRDVLRPLTKVAPELADHLYHQTLTAFVGDRHRTLLDAAIRIVCTYNTNDPLVPYRLIVNAGTTMGKSVQEIWNISLWAAAAFAGIREDDRKERMTATARAAKAMGVPPADVARRLIIDLGSEQFVWDEGRERYSSGCSHQHQVLTTADQLCPTLVEDWFSSFAEIMRAHSTKARRLVYTYTPNQGGFDANTETMYVPVCRPDPSIVAKFDPEVQGWLEALFGKGESPYYESVMDWLAALPRLDMPVCALYIDGPRSVGKGLLTYGIARLWSRECRTVPYEELLEDFNETLTMSPLVYADEKVPHGKQQDSSVFRRMVGNSSFKVNAKFRSPAIVEGYPRIIITANNAEALTFREDLDPNDIDALRLRLGYVKVTDAGERYLKDLAKQLGAPSARHMADSWRSDGRIAAHILYLSQHRDFVPGSRFLVEGWDSPLIRHLPSNVGSAGLIMDAVVAAMTSTRKRWDSIRWFDDQVFICNTALAEEWEDLMHKERMPLSNSRVKALKSLSGGKSLRLDIETHSAARVQKMYWAIPAITVARAAEDRGVAESRFILDACARKTDSTHSTVHAEETVLGL